MKSDCYSRQSSWCELRNSLNTEQRNTILEPRNIFRLIPLNPMLTWRGPFLTGQIESIFPIVTFWPETIESAKTWVIAS